MHMMFKPIFPQVINNYYKFWNPPDIWKEHTYYMVELIFISFMLIYWLANTL